MAERGSDIFISRLLHHQYVASSVQRTYSQHCNLYLGFRVWHMYCPISTDLSHLQSDHDFYDVKLSFWIMQLGKLLVWKPSNHIELHAKPLNKAWASRTAFKVHFEQHLFWLLCCYTLALLKGVDPSCWMPINKPIPDQASVPALFWQSTWN